MKIIAYIFLISVFLNCAKVNTIPSETEKYLNEVVDLLEKKSVNKNKINWTDFRDRVFEKAGGAKTIEDTYSAVSFAVAMLEDNHSYFRASTELQSGVKEKPLPVLSDELTPEDIGYIRLPFCIGSEEDLDKYILSVQTKIIQQSKNGVKGWIIDLRGNFGGNMWPMLLAIEPFIGNETLGYFVDADDKYESWKLINGKAYIDDVLVYENKDFVKLDISNQFVAVLIDNETASSGEAVTVAFKNRVNTMLFGVPTYGVSTGCVSHELSDGSVINLTESMFADRKKNKYGYKIIPDVETEINETLTKAMEWIYASHIKTKINE